MQTEDLPVVVSVLQAMRHGDCDLLVLASSSLYDDIECHVDE